MRFAGCLLAVAYFRMELLKACRSRRLAPHALLRVIEQASRDQDCQGS